MSIPTYTIPKFDLLAVDWSILIIYFIFVLGVGFALKRYMKTSTDFFLSGKSIAAWITGLAFISANLGAQEVIGMAASGAKYGIATSHFYWIGAIPAMIFVGIFMMPFYYGSKARSVPEYLKLRFDEKTRGFNALSFAAMTIFSSGISMYAMGKLLNLLLGWDFHTCVLVSGFIVLLYTFLGGLTSAIYNEVIQFFLIVFGFIPLVFLGLKNVGGWAGVKARLAQEGWFRSEVLAEKMNPDALTHSWKYMGEATANPMGVEWFGLVMGLGFVLSFGYWCTDFLVVQRAMAAKDMSAARRTPLIAAIPKMLFPLLVILPGMLAIGIAPLADKVLEPSATSAKSAITLQIEQSNPELAQRLVQHGAPSMEELTALGGRGLVPPKIENVVSTREGGKKGEIVFKKQRDGQPILDKRGQPIVELDYDLVIPMMLHKYFPAGLLGLGLCALMASFMSGMAGNTTAFNTVWTYDIYQSYIRKNAPDKHYLWMGRYATVGGILLSMLAAYAATRFNNIMDILQLVFAFVNAPLFATFMLGMFWRRATGHGAFCGLVSGTLAALIHHGLTLPYGSMAGMKGGFFALVHTYPSEMAQNFWTAIFAWTTCFVVTIVVSLATRQTKKPAELKGLVYSLTPKPSEDGIPWYKQPAYLGGAVLAVTLVLNIIFW
ncbi:MAG: sodium:solute symporter family protein [Limisphaerales bacterium]|jgi:SSS family solute:Na+ symporter|nr:Na+/galactose cotransporter [Verrucomicrobiota bacterium]